MRSPLRDPQGPPICTPAVPAILRSLTSRPISRRLPMLQNRFKLTEQMQPTGKSDPPLPTHPTTPRTTAAAARCAGTGKATSGPAVSSEQGAWDALRPICGRTPVTARSAAFKALRKPEREVGVACPFPWTPVATVVVPAVVGWVGQAGQICPVASAHTIESVLRHWVSLPDSLFVSDLCLVGATEMHMGSPHEGPAGGSHRSDGRGEKDKTHPSPISGNQTFKSRWLRKPRIMPQWAKGFASNTFGTGGHPHRHPAGPPPELPGWLPAESACQHSWRLLDHARTLTYGQSVQCWKRCSKSC